MPLICGSAGTGKTTLALPFDRMSGLRHVTQKSAFDGRYALRGIFEDSGDWCAMVAVQWDIMEIVFAAVSLI